MSQGTPRSTKSNQNAAKHAQGNVWETFYPVEVHVGTNLNPMLRYDFFQRRLVFNGDAMKFMKSNRVRFTANRALCTFRVVPVHGIDIHACLISRQGSIEGCTALRLMQWMRMDTNNKTLIGALALLPQASGILEASYADLVTRRAAAIAGEVIAAEAESSYAASPG